MVLCRFWAQGRCKNGGMRGNSLLKLELILSVQIVVHLNTLEILRLETITVLLLFSRPIIAPPATMDDLKQTVCNTFTDIQTKTDSDSRSSKVHLKPRCNHRGSIIRAPAMDTLRIYSFSQGSSTIIWRSAAGTKLRGNATSSL